MSELSKYAENQFLVATRNSNILCSEIISDAKSKLTFAATQDARFTPILNELISSSAVWDTAETSETNRTAALASATLGLDEKLDSLTHKPNADTNSTIVQWDNIIIGQVAEGGTTYTFLLPNGRETLTKGTIEQQIDAGRDFAARLAEQTAKPILVTLGTTVATFYTIARALRTTQNTAKNSLTNARRELEHFRILNCEILIAMVGTGMSIYRSELERVDDLFSISLLRGPVQTTPAAPTDTAWDGPTKTASTTTLPAEATRLELYRQAPGSAPELLDIGLPHELSVTASPEYLWTVGTTYEIWLQARNSRGTSAPGPKQLYTPA